MGRPSRWNGTETGAWDSAGHSTCLGRASVRSEPEGQASEEGGRAGRGLPGLPLRHQGTVPRPRCPAALAARGALPWPRGRPAPPLRRVQAVGTAALSDAVVQKRYGNEQVSSFLNHEGKPTGLAEAGLVRACPRVGLWGCPVLIALRRPVLETPAGPKPPGQEGTCPSPAQGRRALPRCGALRDGWGHGVHSFPGSQSRR